MNLGAQGLDYKKEHHGQAHRFCAHIFARKGVTIFFSLYNMSLAIMAG